MRRIVFVHFSAIGCWVPSVITPISYHPPIQLFVSRQIAPSLAIADGSNPLRICNGHVRVRVWVLDVSGGFVTPAAPFFYPRAFYGSPLLPTFGLGVSLLHYLCCPTRRRSMVAPEFGGFSFFYLWFLLLRSWPRARAVSLSISVSGSGIGGINPLWNR